VKTLTEKLQDSEQAREELQKILVGGKQEGTQEERFNAALAKENEGLRRDIASKEQE